MTERLRLTSSDGVTLEARIDSPPEPQYFTVFCHPHPQHGGSMNAPLMIAIANRLVDRGHAVLRFNFRGTGSSDGEHDNGRGELLDVEAAMTHAQSSGLSPGLGGWSFGASTALRWHAERQLDTPYVGIAPPPQDLPSDLAAGPKRIILGTRDQVIDGDSLTDYSLGHGIDLILTPGDHFFHGRGTRVGDLVGQGLED